MRADLKEIVEGYRKDGLPLSDEEAEDIEKFCYRKMEVAKVKNPDEYIFLLFPDELKRFLFRRWVNAKTELMMIKKEERENVFSMQTDTVSPTMPQCAGTGGKV